MRPRYVDLARGRAPRAPNTTWLTPPAIIKALGPFDLDPCCPAQMPWRTARRMYHWPKDDGLSSPWRGRVWLNPPFDCPLPWIKKFCAHGNGVCLVNVSGLTAKWGQQLLLQSDVVLVVRGRISFCLADGRPTTGKMNGHAFAAVGRRNVLALQALCVSVMPGVLLTKAKF